MRDPIPRLNAALEGRYRIERQLGEGGMATVYLARDERHARHVALKVLKPELAAVVGADRFLAEIETTANLQHPHILPLFDSGEADSFLFYVMPYVEGESLRDRLDRERQLPVDEAVGIATKIAGALQAAHDQGVIHRDIKPANVLLSKGEPLVSDFGIALAVGAAGGGRLTETGLSLGTPHYMSPEQATGDLNLGPASDVYALGCVLYEMLAGEPPYTGSTGQAILGKIIQAELVPVTKCRRSVPVNVDAAIRQALEKLSADRFASARAFADALTDPTFRHGDSAGAGVGAPRSWRPLTAILAATATIAALAFTWPLLRPEEQRPVARFDVTPEEGNLVPEAVGVGVTISPDGQRLVYVGVGEDGGTQLWERRLDDLQPRPLRGTEGGDNPVFSPDGQSVAFWDDDITIKTVSLSGGIPFTIVTSGGVSSRYIDWGTDGYIYYARGDSSGYTINRAPATGGQPEQVTSVVEDARQTGPRVLPGGRGLLVTLRRGVIEEATVGVVGPEGGEVRELFLGISAVYAASGHLVYASAENVLMAVPFDLSRLETSGPPFALLQGIAVREPGLGAHFALSETGTLVYRSGGPDASWEFVWVTRSGQATPVHAGWSFAAGSANRGWRLSPDGTQLAVREVRQGNSDVWIKELDTGPLSRVTLDDRQDHSPYWTPDGSAITFTSDRAGVGQLWTKRADGTGEAGLLFGDMGTNVEMGFWSPDREWLVLSVGPVSGGGGRWRDVLVMRPGVDSVTVPLLAGSYDEVSPAVSPDTRWVAYASNETGTYEAFVRPFPDVNTGKVQVSTAGGIMPTWARSGRELFFVDNDRNLVAARVLTEGGAFAISGMQVLFTFDYAANPRSTMFDIGPDDDRFLMVRPYENPRDVPRLFLVQNFFEELKRLVPQ